jgi:chromosome segregation protein
VYLKRLELLGFKSFATKTVFDFGQGMTAIVGPNGSGKSNIADSLRWVLGETSNRLIRAKKLEDVIYAGSAKRPRADKVEVSMVLDNSTKWLPIDEQEVTITRRGSRSGDSDYYVNGRRAKLRDIQTILATASVSQSSYAIIGQGLVESVLNLRPEDRREMIEEAADIQRYRFKIEEAESRLRQTGENVERVKLLVKEIAPRMGSLERQARRAGEHARLSLQLQQALREYYEQRWEHAQEAVTVARAAHDQAQAEYLQAKVSLETLQRELDEITGQLEENRKAAASAIGERDRLTQIIRESEQGMAVARERRSILQERHAELSEEVASVEKEKEQAAAVLASGDADRKRLEDAVAAARQAMIDRQGELASLEAELREAHVHAADADAKAKRLQAVSAEMRGRIKRLQEAAARLNGDVSRQETRRRSIINQMMEHLRVLKGLRTQDVQFLDDVSGGGARREALEADIHHLRESLALVEANQNARRGKLEGLEARLKVLQEAQVQAAEVDDAVTLEGAVSALYEILRVPRGLEVAIAAVLGDQLDSYVFNHQSDAVAAIYALVRGEGPRAAAIPLDTMKQVYPLNVAKEKGVLGVASSLVKYPPRFEKLINTLLGRVVVVEDVDTAIRLLKRRVGTIVTVDGIVFDQSGFIWGGRPGDARSFILAYERDLESIPNEMERIRRAIDVTEREADLFRERLRTAEAALSEMTREGDAVVGRRLQLQDQIVMRQQKLAQLRGELRGVMGQIQNVREQQKSFVQQAELLEKEREGLLAEAAEAAETAKHLGKADTLFKDRRKAMQKALEEATDGLGRVDAELRSLNVQKETAAATLARIDAQANAKAVQLRGIEMEVSTLDTSIEKEETAAAEARRQLEELVSRLPDGEGARHLEARQADLHKQVVAGQTRSFEAERRTLETEAEVRRWDTEIENLQMRMTEDGLVMRADGTVHPEKGGALDVEVPAWMLAEDDGSGGLRPMQGGAIIDHDALEKEINSLRLQLRQIGPVNVEAQVDYESLRERHDFLTGQLGDLENAEAALHRAIEELTNLMRKKFELAFEQVAKNFEKNFNTFFGGGHARLKLTDPKHAQTSGVEIEARPPGKRTNSLAQLSGGEKSLTSVALLFALLQVNPAPFCVLDEVDAMLDEANVGRFAASIKEQSRRTQFIVITHNRRTIEQADSIYGISIAPDAASRVLSMRLADVTAASGVQN